MKNIVRVDIGLRFKSIAKSFLSLVSILVFLLLTFGYTQAKTEWPHVVLSKESAVSIVLLPRSATFDIGEVPQGAVSFTASIKNEGTTTVKIAHPSISLPADYKQGELKRFNDSRGKSEILLKIKKPDGTDLVLRDGYIHFFDPGNVPLITIPPNGIGTFDVGWFFQNARGRWEQDEEAANVFLSKGRYKISMLFRNVFPKAVLYDQNTMGGRFIDVWTGEMESPEITVEVK